MSPFLAVFLVLVLGSTCYAAGRLHGQLSYRIGYRFGYRQGYFDGDRGAWNRRRRDGQAAIPAAHPVSTPARSATASGSVAARARPTRVSGSVAAPALPAAASGTVAPTADPLRGTATRAADPRGPSSPGPSTRGTASAQLGTVAARQGTTYTGAAFAAPVGTVIGRHPTGALVPWQG